MPRRKLKDLEDSVDSERSQETQSPPSSPEASLEKSMHNMTIDEESDDPMKDGITFNEPDSDTYLYQPINKNLTHFKGCIASISLTNFMTYDSLFFEPKPGLNIICGPNGTGKSSLTAALCLGLNGKVDLTGRAKEIESYVKGNYHKKKKKTDSD